MAMYAASTELSGMVSLSPSNSRGLGTIQGSDDSKDCWGQVEIILTVAIWDAVGGSGVGKVPMRLESFNKPTPTLSYVTVWSPKKGMLLVVGMRASGVQKSS